MEELSTQQLSDQSSRGQAYPIEKRVEKSISWKCASDIINQLGLTDKDYNFSYHDLKEGLDKINSEEIDCFIYDTVYPSNDLKY